MDTRHHLCECGTELKEPQIQSGVGLCEHCIIEGMPFEAGQTKGLTPEEVFKRYYLDRIAELEKDLRIVKEDLSVSGMRIQELKAVLKRVRTHNCVCSNCLSVIRVTLEGGA